MKRSFETWSLGILIFLIVGHWTVVFAEKIQLIFPVACELSHDCYINHYVDRDPSPGFKDFTGGRLSYDAHKGTDIAISTYARMRSKVAVLAAADGNVINVRDGEKDRFRHEGGYPEGKECGNGIVIKHQGGYKTQYCHLLEGSVKVAPGQQVKAGDILGYVGSSGNSDFPHLHIQLYANDKIVDPFDPNLWVSPIPYKPFGLIDMGMDIKTLKMKDVLDVAPRRLSFTLEDPLMVAWVRIFGVQAEDQQRFTFYQPNGKIYRSPVVKKFTKPFKEWFAFAGYHIAGRMKPSLQGQWKVTYELKRGVQPWKLLGSYNFDLKREVL